MADETRLLYDLVKNADHKQRQLAILAATILIDDIAAVIAGRLLAIDHVPDRTLYFSTPANVTDIGESIALVDPDALENVLLFVVKHHMPARLCFADVLEIIRTKNVAEELCIERGMQLELALNEDTDDTSQSSPQGTTAHQATVAAAFTAATVEPSIISLDTLPTEVACMVLDYLDVAELKAMRTYSRRYNDIILDLPAFKSKLGTVQLFLDASFPQLVLQLCKHKTWRDTTREVILEIPRRKPFYRVPKWYWGYPFGQPVGASVGLSIDYLASPEYRLALGVVTSLPAAVECKFVHNTGSGKDKSRVHRGRFVKAFKAIMADVLHEGVKDGLIGYLQGTDMVLRGRMETAEVYTLCK